MGHGAVGLYVGTYVSAYVGEGRREGESVGRLNDEGCVVIVSALVTGAIVDECIGWRDGKSAGRSETGDGVGFAVDADATGEFVADSRVDDADGPLVAGAGVAGTGAGRGVGRSVLTNDARSMSKKHSWPD